MCRLIDRRWSAALIDEWFARVLPHVEGDRFEEGAAKQWFGAWASSSEDVSR